MSKAEVAAFAEKFARDEHARRAKEAANPDPRPRCLFCGRAVRSEKRQYCPACIRDGFNNVHIVTGRTNGWNFSGGRTEAEPGWRGRPVMGGNATKERPSSS